MLKNKKIKYLNLIPILLISFILYKLVDKVDYLYKGFKFILSLLSPFIWAFAIAYILNPLMTFIENKFSLKRVWSILIVYVLLLGIIVLGITIIIPRTVNSMIDLVKEMPKYIEATEIFINDLMTTLEKYGIAQNLQQSFNNILDQATSYLDLAINNTVTTVIDFTSAILKLVFGIIISVYVLYGKESFVIGMKKILNAFFSGEKVRKINKLGREVDTMFSQFIIGKLIDSLIIGLLCFIGLLIIKAPFAMLLSVIVGVTNMIPYFGPIIGMIPAGIVTLFYSPIKALWVVIFIILLQQFDGWVLGPKILGDKVGLTPFWILLAITVGGGTFGVLGMFLGVPVVAVIKNLAEEYIEDRINSKDLTL